MDVKVITPDTIGIFSRREKSLFLAGSIEQGMAENWQADVIEQLKDYCIDIYNPRRVRWNAELEQSFLNKQFREQVNWEQDALACVNNVLLYLSPETKSPISLLELGQLCMQTDKIKTVVACPHGFWRRGNVEIMCIRHGIPLYESLAEAVAHLKVIMK